MIAPAIALAEKGFPASETLARILQQEKPNMGEWPTTRAIFRRGNEPLKRGNNLVQKDVSQSMLLICHQGAKAFYEGAIAQKIAAEMASHPDALTLQDLREYKAAEREPMRGTYRGHEIVTMPPPSSSGPHLVQILSRMGQWPIAQQRSNSAQTIHRMAESMKQAYAGRAEYLGDPDFVKIPLKA